jgi:Na+-translocating ferredoxin:NAD+ oxidoreductase subunit C
MLWLPSFRRWWAGGLFFGPPAWRPAITLAPASGGSRGNVSTKAAELADLLEKAGMSVTSPVTPSLAAQLREAGGVELGVARKGGRQIRAVILNLLATQPESALPAALARGAAEDLLAGLMVVCDAILPRRAIAVIDRHEHGVARPLRQAIKRHRRFSGVTLVRMVNRYPLAHPAILLRAMFGKKLPPDSLPTRANRIVLDPVAAWALGRLAKSGFLPTQRPVQLFQPSAAPRLVMAPIGEKIADLLSREKIAAAGKQVIRNGMLLGEEADLAHAVIDWKTEMIAVRELPLPEPSNPCIACGWCVDHCPTGLSPVRLYEQSLLPAARRGGESLEARHCIGCGLCSYVCPTRLPLAAMTVRLRMEIVETPVPLTVAKTRGASDE